MEYRLDIANQVLLFSMLALSLNLLMGYAGQVSAAHAAFAGIGGYAVAKLTMSAGMGFPPAIVLAVLFAAIMGVLISLPALRLALESLLILTLSAGMIFVTFVSSISGFGGTYGLRITSSPSIFGREFNYPSEYFGPFLLLAIAVFLVCWRLGESPFGRVLKAIREDETAARAVGKNVFFYKVAVFGITAGIAGLTGAMIASYNQLVAPVQFSFSQVMLMFTIVIFGGMGNLFGSVLGAAVIIVSTPVLEHTLSIGAEKAALVRLLIYGAILILLMCLRPEGLLPENVSLRPLLRWVRHWREGAQPALASATATSSTLPATVPPIPRDLAARSDNPSRPQNESENGDGRPMARVQGLTKSFGGIVAVDKVDIVLLDRHITGLVGPNGAGKTTLFNLLTGMVSPDEGKIELRGKSIEGKTPDAIVKMGMARSFQDVRLFLRMTVLQNVMLATLHHPGETIGGLFVRPLAVTRAERRAKQRALECLSFVGLADKAGVLAGSLAFGEQKLVAIARLLATEADVLLLDEPTSGIDPQWVDNVGKTIAALPTMGKTVCIVEHNLHALEQVADRCYFMEYGRVTAEGTLRELMNEPRLVKAYFGGQLG